MLPEIHMFCTCKLFIISLNKIMKLLSNFENLNRNVFRPKNRRHPSLHQAGDSGDDRFSSSRIRRRSRHPRTHHLRLRRSRTHGNGEFIDSFAKFNLKCHEYFISENYPPQLRICNLRNWSVDRNLLFCSPIFQELVFIAIFIVSGQTFVGRSFRHSGTKHRSQLHRNKRSKTWYFKRPFKRRVFFKKIHV